MFSKKIVLIQLPSPYLLVENWITPMHLYYLQAYLKKMGFRNVLVVNLAGKDNYKQLIPPDCDYYGMSVFTPQYSMAKEISAYIKNNFKGTIIAGGHHITALPKESLKGSDIDIAVIGEGEHTLFDLASQKPLSEIPGIAYKENSKILINQPRGFEPNIDNFPFPDMSQINLQEYHGMVLDKDKKIFEMSLITSRGCPFNCAFCVNKRFWKQTVRFHSAEYVIEALDILHERGINNFRFVDDNFDLNKPRLWKILEHLKKLNSKWNCSMRSRNVTDETISAMKESGLTEVSLGIESGSDKILKIINKEEDVKDHIKAITTLKKYGIIARAFMMSGLPGEDQATVDETIKFIKEQPADFYTLFTFTPFPGTDVWEHPEQFNYPLDRVQSYDNYTILSKDKSNPSVSKDEEKLLGYRKQLLEACENKSTITRSLNIAENLETVTKWKEAF